MTLQEQVDHLKKQLHDWQQLQTLAGWARLDDIVRGQIITRRSRMNVNSMDAAFEAATMNGEIGGMQLIMSFPGIMIEELQMQLSDVLAELNEEQDNG